MEYVEIDANSLDELLVEIDAANKQYEQPENALALVKEIKKKGVDVAYDWSAKDLVNCLRTADQAYYNSGASLTKACYNNYAQIITDKVYDQLFDILKERFPKNKYLNKVGAETPKNLTTHASQRMTKLPFPMASLDKIKPETAEKWLKDKDEILISNKVDGISLGIVSDGKGNINLFSRGDALHGQSLDHLIPYLRTLKKLLKTKKKFIIRAEIVMPESKFKNYVGDYKNSRNMMAGIINKGSISSAFKDANIMAYSVIEPRLKPKEAVNFLKSLGVETPDFKLLKNPTSEKLTDIFVKRRDKADYAMDGLVLQDVSKYEAPTTSNPKYSKAYKDPSVLETANVKVLGIDWSVGKTSSIIPTLLLEPTKLNGVTIKRATAHNAKYIYDNKIGKDAIVKIVRAGEVIPYVEEVIKPAKKPDFPKDVNYVWKGVHIVLDEDAEDQNSSAIDQRNIKRINSFYRALGVENISEATFAKLYENGYDDVFKVAKITPAKLMKIEGFQTVSANKTANTIKEALENVPLYLAMYGSSLFDRVLGSKRFKAIVSQIPQYQKLKPEVLRQKIASLEGFSNATADAFIQGLPLFNDFLEKLQKVANVEMPKKKSNTASSSGGKLNGQTIVFTGFRNKEWSKIIEANGGNEGSNVSNKTTILVTKDPSSNSGKAQKARQLGVKIMGIDEFEKYLKKYGLI